MVLDGPGFPDSEWGLGAGVAAWVALGGTESARSQGHIARPRGTVVYICERRFSDLARRRQAMAEAIIIHEMMHTLGLGENPPTSQEITARVMRRCGGF